MTTSFNDLPLEEKAFLLNEFGTHIDSIQWYDGYCLHLYSINHHFAEVYQRVRTCQIENILMISYKQVDRYTDRIKLNLNFKSTK